MKTKILHSILLFIPLGLIAQNPNWAEHVAPILYQHCTPCHHQGGLAPFSLMSYADASGNAFDIQTDVNNKIMPPWPPDPSYSHLAYERVLSATELQTLNDWVNNGVPEGNPALAPTPPTYSGLATITNPDLQITMPSYTSTASTEDVYRCFVIPSNLATTSFITEMEVIPGNASIVHHVLVFQDTTNVPAQLDAADPLPGWAGFGGTGSNNSKLIGAWVPGSQQTKYPAGFGVRLPQNTNIVLQIHYPKGSDGQKDSTQVRFKLTTGAVRQLYINPLLNHAVSIINGPLFIPANTTKTFIEQFNVPINATVFSVAPHMHLIGRSTKVYGVVSPGDTIPLIKIPNWDFHWQGGYPFKKMVKIPINTKLRAEAFYDNTTNNPHNPNNPPQDVGAGEATTDEMMLNYFTYTYYLPGDENIVIDATPNVAINSPKNDLSFTVFPNPAKDFIQLQGMDCIENFEVKIYDMKGNEVINTQNTDFISVSQLPQGEFLIILKSENHYGTQFWFKQ